MAYRQDYGAFINTPGQMMSAAEAVNDDALRLAADIEASSASASFKSSWNSFLDGWFSFYAGLKGVGGYFTRFWGGTQEQIDDYQRKLADWQANFLKQGGAITGPVIEKPPSTSILDVLGSLKWVLLVGVAGIVAVKFLPGRK